MHTESQVVGSAAIGDVMQVIADFAAPRQLVQIVSHLRLCVQREERRECAEGPDLYAGDEFQSASEAFRVDGAEVGEFGQLLRAVESPEGFRGGRSEGD